MTDRHICIRMPVPAAEALSEGAVPPDGRSDHHWPEDFGSFPERFSEALEAVEDVLNGMAGPDEVGLLVQVLNVADHALRAILLDRARGADVMVIGNTAHAPGGCGYARRADPAVVNSYRRDRLPTYLSTAQGEAWLRAKPKRRRCLRCWPA